MDLYDSISAGYENENIYTDEKYLNARTSKFAFTEENCCLRIMSLPVAVIYFCVSVWAVGVCVRLCMLCVGCSEMFVLVQYTKVSAPAVPDRFRLKKTSWFVCSPAGINRCQN